MKRVCFFLSLWVVLLLPALCFGGETAYQALRALGQERSTVSMDKVIDVIGNNGSPQPSVWKIVLDDPAARGGVREFELQKGHVISERTPVRVSGSGTQEVVMDFHKLNLDSSGAFTVANKEAASTHVGFDSVNYALRSPDGSTAPVWVLKLLDAEGSPVATIHISADNGDILSREGFSSDKGQTTVKKKHHHASENDGFSEKVKRSMIHSGATIEEFFTGHRTLEEKNGY